MNRKLFLLILSILSVQYFGHAQYIVTILGDGTAGDAANGSVALTSKTNWPRSAMKGYGGNIYFVEFNNYKIKMIKPDGTIQHIAGNGTSGFSGDGGPATSAQI